ncbi:MAG: DivIVA domain-containing protein [Lachnospiraceae bacterium]|nr:DivIVA domain-containing protein [Lachnospiraceae bacterium]
MLTPVEIQNKVFKSGGLGYDKKDVDNYIKEIVRSYEDVYRENMELKDKVGVLNEGIRYYKSIEKTLQKALILAEKTAEDTRNNAKKDAKRIEKEAVTNANIMLADARNELESLHQQTIALIQQYEKYKAQFRNLAKAQIDLIESGAFSINVSKLDAFMSENKVLEPIKTASEEVQKTSGKHGKADTDAREDTEDTPDPEQASSGVHLSDVANDNEDYTSFDYQLAGQEEFDFVDLNDE